MKIVFAPVIFQARLVTGSSALNYNLPTVSYPQFNTEKGMIARMKHRLFPLIIILLLLCACTADSDGESSQGYSYDKSRLNYIQSMQSKWKIGDGLTLDWYINVDDTDYIGDWSDYTVLHDACEITGVTPRIILPNGSAKQTMDLMISTNTLPDLITLLVDDSTVDALIENGMLYSLNDLMAKYAPQMRSEISKEVYDYTKSEKDDKLYGLPSFFVPQQQMENRKEIGLTAYSVREDFYTELGRPDISSKDGLLEALRAFSARYPTVDGTKSIPLHLGTDGHGLSVLEQSFAIPPFYVDGDKVYIKYKHPNYEEFTRFVNQLYREGLIDPHFLLAKEPEVTKELSNNAFVSIRNWFEYEDVNLNLKSLFTQFITVPPFRISDKAVFPSKDRKGWTVTMVSKRSKDPETAIRLLHFLWSNDGNLLLNYGYENKSYIIEGENDLYLLSPVGEEDVFGIQKSGIFLFRFLYNSKYSQPSVRTDIWNNVDKYVEDWTGYSYKMRPIPTAAEGTVQTAVDDIVARQLPNMIFAESSEKAVAQLNRMIEMMEKEGLTVLEDYYTRRYAKNLERFS